MTLFESLDQAIQEGRGGDIEQLTQPIYELIESEHPEISDAMTKILAAQIRAVVGADVNEEHLALIAVQYLAMGIWLGRRSKEIELE